LITEFCNGGELHKLGELGGRFEEENVQFYAAEIVLALEYLHD
jgi:serine/threonine protein kinase